MPEEINRLLTDSLSDLLLVSEPSGVQNLEREGVAPERVRLVGNVMIDTLRMMLPAARERETARGLGLPGRYGVVTLHRPSNVDDPVTLGGLLTLLHELAAEIPLVFPVHPRTRKNAEAAGFGPRLAEGNLLCVGPLPYLDTLSLVSGAAVVLTDSGGLQEETSALDVPCLTLRENTERPVTVQLGTSRLVGHDPEAIRRAFAEVAAGTWPTARPIPLWDGAAGGRVAAEIATFLMARGSLRHATPQVVGA